MRLSYKIHYKKGKENVVADALSRRDGEDLECATMISVFPEQVNEVIESYEGDKWVQNLIKEAVLNPDNIPNFSYQNGVLKYHNRVAVGSEGSVGKG